MQVQNRLGADIIMALDDVVPSTAADAQRFAEATERTTRWLDRCIAAHGRPTEQSLFAIVQGGLDERLRAASLEGLVARGTPGYAIGGLAGGEDKRSFVECAGGWLARWARWPSVLPCARPACSLRPLTRPARAPAHLPAPPSLAGWWRSARRGCRRASLAM